MSVAAARQRLIIYEAQQHRAAISRRRECSRQLSGIVPRRAATRDDAGHFSGLHEPPACGIGVTRAQQLLATFMRPNDKAAFLRFAGFFFFRF